MKNHFFIAVSLFLISTSLCYVTDHYVVKQPGEPSNFTQFKRSRRPIEEYVNLQIQDDDVIAQERFKIAKEIELEGRIPYQESRITIITPTSGSSSNR